MLEAPAHADAHALEQRDRWVVTDLGAGAADVTRDRVLELPEHVHRLHVTTALLQEPVDAFGNDSGETRDSELPSRHLER